MRKKIYIFISSLLFPVYALQAQDCSPSDVKNTKEEPYKYICYIRKFNNRGVAFTGTAFLISPRILLTNAHNLYNAKRIDIAPAHHGQGIVLEPNNPALVYGMVQINKTGDNIKFHENFIINENRRAKKNSRHYDYGIIILPDSSLFKRIGGYLEIAACEDFAKQGDTVRFAGYPGGIASYNPELFQKENTGIISGFYEDGSMISYEMGTQKGASGSPVLYFREGRHIAIGIHGYGYDCRNSGVRITSEVIEQINIWKQSIGN